MTDLILHRESSQTITLRPLRGGAIEVRLATLDDVPFVDELQRKYLHMVG